MKKVLNKKIELLLLYIYFATFCFLVLIFKFNYLEMALFYFGVPSVYLVIKQKEILKKLTTSALLVALPVTVILDVIAHQSNAWFETTIFPFRVFGIFPVESFLWAFTYYIFIIAFYEYFFDRYHKIEISKKFKKYFLLLLAGTVATIIIITYKIDLLSIPYFYAIFIATVSLFTIVCLIKFPKLYTKVTLASIFLFIPSLAHEIVSLENGHWIFRQGFHIGYVTLSKYTFPVEEWIWLLIVPIAIILFYEITTDNRK